MGTTWTVKYVAPPAAKLDREAVARRVAERLEQLEQQFSTYREHSELSRFNAAESIEWIPVSTELAWVAAESRRISELTGGAFDATVYPLVQLWGFGARGRTSEPPGTARIDVARGSVDWRRLEVRAEPAALRKTRADLAVDFSSMAKGFAADVVAELLRALGARDHFVQVGGDMRTVGGAASARGWRVGIEQPEGGAGAVACVVELAGEALSTSGNYRNFFTHGGRQYGHVIDPRSGAPASGALASVTVIDATCARSSAWATGLFVLGADEGRRLAEREGLACLFIVREPAGGFARRATPAFEKYLRPRKSGS